MLIKIKDEDYNEIKEKFPDCERVCASDEVCLEAIDKVIDGMNDDEYRPFLDDLSDTDLDNFKSDVKDRIFKRGNSDLIDLEFVENTIKYCIDAFLDN